CDIASPTNIEEGAVGVGTGATVGKAAGRERAMKGGFGCATRAAGDAVVCAAAVVNAVGDVRGSDGAILAGARDEHGQFLDSARMLTQGVNASRAGAPTATHTTLCVVATNQTLRREELAQLASAAGAALFRRITPAGTSYDGDVIFALCPAEGLRGTAMTLELLAASALEEAI